MSCENLEIPKPLTNQCPTTLFGIPYGAAGRTVAGITYPISAIVLHCYDGTIAELCNEMKCRTRSSVISGSYENSFHYSIGAAAGSGGFQQHVEDNNISWTFGTYKNNTYATVPPPNIAINWPVLQGEFGINTTPDVYTIDIALAIGEITAASSLSGCYTCPTASGLQQTQHDMLVQMLAYLVQEYNLPIDQDHIQFHDLIHCGEGQECPCTDIETLLVEVASYCPPCEQEAVVAPVAETNDVIEYIYGITEACCPTSPGCAVKIPWNGCFIGDLATDGTLDNYILGLAQDPVTMQWCLTRGCLGVISPLVGCGTVDDPLQLDRCAIETWIDSAAPLSQVNRVMGVDDNGCWTLEGPDSFVDRIICANPENDTSTPTWVLAQGDTCPEWVTPTQIVQAGLSVTDSNCVDLTFVGGVLSVEPIIAPTQGGVPNGLSCLVDGLYVAAFSLTGGDCVGVTDNGDGTHDLDLIVAPAQSGVSNWLQCIAGQGAFVPEPTFTDGQTVDFTVSGPFNNDITAEVIVSPIADNTLLAVPSGLYNPPIIVVDTGCININYVANVLSITPIVSPAVGGVINVFDCLATGMYVPRGANALVNGPLTGNGSDVSPLDINFSLLTNQDLCDFGEAIPSGTLVDIVGRDAADCLRRQTIEDVIATALNVDDTPCIDLTLTGNILTADPIISPAIGGVDNVLLCTANGLYVPETAGLSVLDTNCINLTLTSGVLSATPIIDPDADNQLSCGVNGLSVPIAAGITTIDTDCLDIDLVGGVLSGTIIIAGAQAGVPNIIQCIPGQGLYIPEGGGLSVVDTECVTLSLVSGVLSADLDIDPDPTNIIQCGPTGLYVPEAAGINVIDTNCINLTLTGNDLTADPIIAPAQAGVENILTCLANGLFVPELTLCDIGEEIAGEAAVEFGFNDFVGLDPTTDCLTHGDRKHEFAGATYPPADCVGNGFTVGSKYVIPTGTFPGQALPIIYILTDYCTWTRVAGGTQIGVSNQNIPEPIPANLDIIPNTSAITFDVLGEYSLVTDAFTVTLDGKYIGHMAAQIQVNPPLNGDDILVEMGFLVDGGLIGFSPILERISPVGTPPVLNITGATQPFSASPGQVIQAIIRHNGNGPATLSSLTINWSDFIR